MTELQNKKEPQGDRVKRLREHLNLSQNAFAKAVGVTQGNVSQIELNGTASIDILLNVSEKFKCDKLWLIDGSGEMFPENVATKGITIPIEALEMAERMTEKVRADYNERISELNRTIEFLMTLVKDKKKVA